MKFRRNFFLLLIVLISIMGSLRFLTGKDIPIPKLFLRELKNRPAIDGKIEENEWNGSLFIKKFVSYDGKTKVKYNTQARLGAYGDSLYILFVCYDNNPRGLLKNHFRYDSSVWLDDVVEIFLSPFPDGKKYWHFGVNAGGARADEFCEDGTKNLKQNTLWESAVKVYNKYWIVEIRIPFASLQVPNLNKYKNWRINLAREKTKDGEYTCYSPTLGGFHTPARFAYLSLENIDLSKYKYDLIPEFKINTYGEKKIIFKIRPSDRNISVVLLNFDAGRILSEKLFNRINDKYISSFSFSPGYTNIYVGLKYNNDIIYFKQFGYEIPSPITVRFEKVRVINVLENFVNINEQIEKLKNEKLTVKIFNEKNREVFKEEYKANKKMYFRIPVGNLKKGIYSVVYILKSVKFGNIIYKVEEKFVKLDKVISLTKGRAIWIYGMRDSYVDFIKQYNKHSVEDKKIKYIFPYVGSINFNTKTVGFNNLIVAYYKKNLPDLYLLPMVDAAAGAFNQLSESEIDKYAEIIVGKMNHSIVDGIQLDLEPYREKQIELYKKIYQRTDKLVTIAVGESKLPHELFRNCDITVLMNYDNALDMQEYDKRTYQRDLDFYNSFKNSKGNYIMMGMPAMATHYEYEYRREKKHLNNVYRTGNSMADYLITSISDIFKVGLPKDKGYLGESIWALVPYEQNVGSHPASFPYLVYPSELTEPVLDVLVNGKFPNSKSIVRQFRKKHVSAPVIDINPLIISDFDKEDSFNSLGAIAYAFSDLDEDSTSKTYYRLDTVKSINKGGDSLYLYFDVPQNGNLGYQYAGFYVSFEPINISKYETLSFLVYGKEDYSNKINVTLRNINKRMVRNWLKTFYKQVLSNGWTKYSISLSKFKISRTAIVSVSIAVVGGHGEVLIDDIQLSY